MSDFGFVSLHRCLKDKPIWLKSSPEHKVILITLMMMANHKPSQWEWKGEKFEVKEGQFITSLESIVLNCGKGISIQNVRSALKRFEKLQFLTNESTKTGRLISIVNWRVYQGTKIKTNKDTNKEVTKNQQRGNKEVTTNNNDNNDNNNNNKKHIYGDFKNVFLNNDEYKKLEVKLGRGVLENLIVDLDNYIESTGKKYKSHCATIQAWHRKSSKEIKKETKNSGYNSNCEQRQYTADDFEQYYYKVTE